LPTYDRIFGRSLRNSMENFRRIIPCVCITILRDNLEDFLVKEKFLGFFMKKLEFVAEFFLRVWVWQHWPPARPRWVRASGGLVSSSYPHPPRSPLSPRPSQQNVDGTRRILILDFIDIRYFPILWKRILHYGHFHF
jgi:hypothetical protein